MADSFNRNPIKSKDDFKNYCLRQLGDGVITVNVSEEQLDDCINDAVKWAQEFLDEGNFLSIVSHEITREDIDNGYFQLPDNVLGVKDIFHQSDSSNQMFTVSYMTKVGLIDALARPLGGLTDYYMMRMNLSQLDMLINPNKPFRFDYNTGRLYLDINWANTIVEKSYIVFKAYIAIDPVENPKLWNNNYLKKYCTALIQKKWGQNLSKYSGISLPGNTSVNGEKILSDANEELDRLQKEVEQYSSNPSPFWVSVLG